MDEITLLHYNQRDMNKLHLKYIHSKYSNNATSNIKVHQLCTYVQLIAEYRTVFKRNI